MDSLLDTLRSAADGGRFSERYELGGHLGDGSTARVYEVRSSAGRFALKLAERATQPSHCWVRTVQILHRENLLLQDCGEHPHIARWVDWFASSGAVGLVLELGAGGDCQQLLRHRGPLIESQVRPMIAQLCSAVAHLQSHSLVHRDIKLENLLAIDEAWPPRRLCLCDLGHACTLLAAGDDVDFLGTPGYAAPEVANGPIWSYEADLFSIGVVMYALLANTLPVVSAPGGADEPPDLSTRPWWAVSVEAKLFLLSLLAARREDRPALTEARAGPWLAGGTEVLFFPTEAPPFLAKRGYSDSVLDLSAATATVAGAVPASYALATDAALAHAAAAAAAAALGRLSLDDSGSSTYVSPLTRARKPEWLGGEESGASPAVSPLAAVRMQGRLAADDLGRSPAVSPLAATRMQGRHSADAPWRSPSLSPVWRSPSLSPVTLIRGGPSASDASIASTRRCEERKTRGDG
jgi:serine/threonine protein kinase